MPNFNPNLDNLKSYKPKWLSGKTQTIRVPIAIAEKVLKIAHEIDKKQFIDTSDIKCNNIELDRSKFIELAHKIIKQKKSAKISLEKFIQEIFQDKDVKL